MNFPKDLKYTKEHEWARVEGNMAVVGITDYAQDKLGSIVFVELPRPGKAFIKGEIMVTVDSVKAVAEVYSPLTGQVEEVNESLKDSPEVINQEPYGKGWMVKLKMANPKELGVLMSLESYEALVSEEEAKG
jgi:glycine cleavage system H protein